MSAHQDLPPNKSLLSTSQDSAASPHQGMPFSTTTLPFSGPALWTAATPGETYQVHRLLVRGADIEERNGAGSTALCSASELGHVQVVQVLLDKGADVEMRTHDELTPLYISSAEGHDKIAQQLLTKGADPNLTTKDHWTPLHRATLLGRCAAVHILLENSADVTRDSPPCLEAREAKIVNCYLRNQISQNWNLKTGICPPQSHSSPVPFLHLLRPPIEEPPPLWQVNGLCG